MKLSDSIADWIGQVLEFVTTPPDPSEKELERMNTRLNTILEATGLKWAWTMKAEILTFIFFLVVFFNIGPWLRHADSTAAPLDSGVLSMPLVGVVAAVAAVILFYLVIRVSMPFVDKWFDGDLMKDADPEKRISFETDWVKAGPVVRICTFVVVFAVIGYTVASVTVAAFH